VNGPTPPYSQQSSSWSPNGEQTQQWLRAWAPDLAGGLLVLFVGYLEAVFAGWFSLGAPRVAITLGMAVAVTCTRHRPAVALGLVWLIGLLQYSGGADIMLIQLSIVYVAFGTARWGSTATLWTSILSVPAAVIGGLAFTIEGGSHFLYQLPGGTSATVAAEATGLPWQLISAGFVLGLLLVPWLLGLAVRLGVRASASQASLEVAEAGAARAQRETEQAREIAALREEQARLAPDVHDGVGHSLAVILAQAESAQYLDDDPVVLKQTMVTIATSARSSLQDIRQVLAGARQTGAAPPPGSFEELIEGVRAGGHQVMTNEIGQSRPLPPELEVVAHRVLQEMLTNAIKHGRRDRPVSVERHWPEGPWAQDLRIEVRNIAGSLTADTKPIGLDTGEDAGGQGLAGMRRRLEAVGGKLDVRQRDEPEGPIFTVTAWVPVSGR